MKLLQIACAWFAILCAGVAARADEAAKIMLFNRGNGKWTQRFEITWAQALALPSWSPYDGKPIPLSLHNALQLMRQKTAGEPVRPVIDDISIEHGRGDAVAYIWYYEIYATEEDKARHIWNDCHVVVLMDGTVLMQTSPLNQ